MKQRKRKLTGFELETIINFNEGEDTAYIFTYNKAWQKQLEKKLGLKPVLDNGEGGRKYEISKERIKPPRAKKILSIRVKEEMKKRLAVGRQTRIESVRKL